VVKGVMQVEEGDFDAAIITLDRAARRLATVPERSRDLSHAYLYLGIAYLGKGLEAAAKAQFREALRQIQDLTLSPEKYPPRIIDLLEAARQEMQTTADEVVEKQVQSPNESERRSKMPLILLAAGGAGAGVALAALSGESGSSNGTDTTGTLYRAGLLTREEPLVDVQVGPGGAGGWKAEISWTDPGSPVRMEVFTSSWEWVIDSHLLTPTLRTAEWEGGAMSSFWVQIYLAPEAEQTAGSVEFRLEVTYPRP